MLGHSVTSVNFWGVWLNRMHQQHKYSFEKITYRGLHDCLTELWHTRDWWWWRFLYFVVLRSLLRGGPSSVHIARDEYGYAVPQNDPRCSLLTPILSRRSSPSAFKKSHTLHRAHACTNVHGYGATYAATCCFCHIFSLHICRFPIYPCTATRCIFPSCVHLP